MAASVSSTGSVGDRTRFFRLSLIIIDELTQILRDLLHNEVSHTHIFNKVKQLNYLQRLCQTAPVCRGMNNRFKYRKQIHRVNQKNG